jgi:hypothetical protein
MGQVSARKANAQYLNQACVLKLGHGDGTDLWIVSVIPKIVGQDIENLKALLFA